MNVKKPGAQCDGGTSPVANTEKYAINMAFLIRKPNYYTI